MSTIKDGALCDMQGSEYACEVSYFMFKILDTSKNHFHPHVWGTFIFEFLHSLSPVLSPDNFRRFKEKYLNFEKLT